MNRFADQGHDDEFGKRKELLFRLDQPSFYALKFGQTLLAAVGGVIVNTRMVVCDGTGGTVPGLFAIGNAVGAAME